MTPKHIIFIEVMEDIKFLVNYNCFGVNEKIGYNEDSCLNIFLIEMSEAEGKILVAILKTLAETQNNFLSYILEEKDVENQSLYIIQQAKKTRYYSYP